MEKKELPYVLKIAELQEKCLQMLEEKRILEECLDLNMGNSADIYRQIESYLSDIEGKLNILDEENKKLSKFIQDKDVCLHEGIIYFYEKTEEWTQITTIKHEQLQSK
jgi:hypothetical protein